MLARKIILGFGIAMLVPMLTHYGIDIFVPSPMEAWRVQGQRSSQQYRQLAQLREQERRAATEDEKAKLRQQIDLLEQRREGEQQSREALQAQSKRVRFFVAIPIGILATLAGASLAAHAVGSGLMLGGIFTFTNGCWWYWADLPATSRFLVLLIGFGVLWWIGYRRLPVLQQQAKSA